MGLWDCFSLQVPGVFSRLVGIPLWDVCLWTLPRPGLSAAFRFSLGLPCSTVALDWFGFSLPSGLLLRLVAGGVLLLPWGCSAAGFGRGWFCRSSGVLLRSQVRFCVGRAFRRVFSPSLRSWLSELCFLALRGLVLWVILGYVLCSFFILLGLLLSTSVPLSLGSRWGSGVFLVGLLFPLEVLPPDTLVAYRFGWLHYREILLSYNVGLLR